MIIININYYSLLKARRAKARLRAMGTDLESLVLRTAKNLIAAAVTRIPDDVVDALRKAMKRETNPLAKKQLEAILRNIDLAASTRGPVCQDTGMMIFFLEVGEDFPLKARLSDILVRAVREATQEVPLRPNAIDPVRNKNSGDNTGRYMPWIGWEIVPGDKLKIAFMAKGGGSEYPSTLVMIPPAEGLRGVKRVVLETIFKAGPKPCPPVVVGVGFAGASDAALKLAKKALLRPIGERHPEPEIAALEEELLERINKLGIGPHGFGGFTTALDVKVDYGYRHPASFAVGVTVACWAMRRSTAVVSADGSVEYLTHKYLNEEV